MKSWLRWVAVFLLLATLSLIVMYGGEMPPRVSLMFLVLAVVATVLVVVWRLRSRRVAFRDAATDSILVDGSIARDGQRGRVVLTHGRSLHALAAARSLGRRGLEVIGCDEAPLMALSFSRYVSDTFLHPSPRADEEKFIGHLVDQLDRRRPRDGRPFVLMPIHVDTPLIARHRDRLETVVQLAAPQVAAINQVDPKNNLIETARRLNVTTPATWMPGSLTALQEIADDVTYPAIIKLPDACASVGLEKVESRNQLVETYRDMATRFGLDSDRRPLIQELVGKDDYCLTLLCNHGRIVAHMAYLNRRTFPSKHGFGVLRETVEADKLVETASRLMASVGWHGVAELDFRWDGHNDHPAFLLEVNPRFWGGLFQSMESGIDFPWLLYELTVNGKISEAPGEARIGTRTKVPVLGFLSAIEEVVQNDDDWIRLEKVWMQGWDEFRSGETKTEIWGWIHELGAAIADRLGAAKLREWSDDTRDAVAEVPTDDDPMAILGVLYVIGSLLRRGKLPDEMRRKSRAKSHETTSQRAK